MSRGGTAMEPEAARADAGTGPRAWLVGVRRVLDRPLTPYHLLIGATTLLLIIGVLMVLSSSSVFAYRHYGNNSYYWATRQLIWVGAAIPIAWLMGRLPLTLLRALSWVMILSAIVLLFLTQTGMGVEVNGNQNWLALGPFQVQPSEAAKLALILWTADVFARKDAHLDDWRHLAIPVVPVMGLVLVPVLMGGDLGTGLVLFAIALGLLWVIGTSWRFFAVAILVVGTAVFAIAVQSAERMKRITSFVNPFDDYLDSGWQAGHGILGLASGGILGKGIGGSQQKWGNLPEAHTDFIFAVLGEELGLVGTLVVLVLFFTIGYAGIRVALATDDLFVRYASAGIVTWLMAHVVINIGMVLTLLPVIGIPLPLVSYGGSSLVLMLVGIGLLVRFARSTPAAAAVIEADRMARRRQRGEQVGVPVAARARSVLRPAVVRQDP